MPRGKRGDRVLVLLPGGRRVLEVVLDGHDAESRWGSTTTRGGVRVEVCVSQADDSP